MDTTQDAARAYLRALVDPDFDDPDDRSDQLTEAQTVELVAAAFVTAITQRFGADTPDRAAVHAYSIELPARYPADPDRVVTAADVEAVILAGYGETEYLADRAGEVIIDVQVTVAVDLVAELQLDVTTFVESAERRAAANPEAPL